MIRFLLGIYFIFLMCVKFYLARSDIIAFFFIISGVSFFCSVNATAGSLHGSAAFVLGNQNYLHGNLDTPINDAVAMTSRLRSNGFNVAHRNNVGQVEIYELIDKFFDSNSGSNIIVFYYAGHAVQVNGRNFLIPVDIPKNSPDVLSHLFDIRYLMDKLTASKATTKIVILDACRDTLFAKSPNAASGLAELKAPPGTLIAFSTMPGATAEDGEGENSPYTTALLDVLFKPNVKIEDAFKEVRRRVMQATDGAQVPTESSLLLEDFYLVKPNVPARGKPGTVPNPIAPKAPAPVAPSASASPASSSSVCSRLMTKLSMGVSPLSPTEQASLAECH